KEATSMKISRISMGAIVLLASALALSQEKSKQKAPAGPGMALTTTAFADGAEIPPKYTQSVPDPISPRLDWTNVPAGTASFALIMHDPDVAIQRKTGDVLHWLIFNIPGSARSLPENVAVGAQGPDGSVQAKNTGPVNACKALRSASRHLTTAT